MSHTFHKVSFSYYKKPTTHNRHKYNDAIFNTLCDENTTFRHVNRITNYKTLNIPIEYKSNHHCASRFEYHNKKYWYHI